MRVSADGSLARAINSTPRCLILLRPREKEREGRREKREGRREKREERREKREEKEEKEEKKYCRGTYFAGLSVLLGLIKD